ncbi:phosphatidylinositol 4-phosphate 5-kinase 5-like [Hibiscus syriacus]|uniref:phosphatidylinositol 4-phosphate 5-kinase 5-like n=1 Tax=Hibiscus syriacus TaxID=106335 RepID=UPI00192049F9|nr:phosphatidylinositol 4-phosphate 5-kinase 5-like [Hibiscus syriacus]
MNKEQSSVLKAWGATMRKTQAAKKRANSIFGITSVANVAQNDVEDDDTAKNVSTSGEPEILENGTNYGEGKVYWPSGASYEGEFKTGYMDGIGVYIGANGDTYKGNWVMNLKHGHGTMHYSNGDLFDGEWRRGVERPLDKASLWENDGFTWAALPGHWFGPPTALLRGFTLAAFPGHWFGPPTTLLRVYCDLAPDKNEHLHDGDGNNLRDLDYELYDDTNPKFNLGLPLKVPKLGKRQGESIYKGHRNYELMLNLQLGIRHSVGRPAPAIGFDLKASAFDPKEKIWTRFPPEGSKYTPPHQSCEFR